MNYQFGLIGYPIKHSLSPWIHESFLKDNQLTGTYSIIEINPMDSFATEIEKLKASNLNGFNVTVPYKEKIIDYLDEIDDQAKHIGAVNTVMCKDGKWIGYNTDGIGYVRSLESKYPEISKSKDLNILLLGAGGAAKGIYYGLVDAGYRNISIANRTIEKAEAIIKQDTAGTNNQLLTIDQAAEDITTFDVIIQTTSVGMKPHAEQSIISFGTLKDNAIVSDIVYQPIVTTFLENAQKLNKRIHLGHTMLLYQAQFAFEIWTNAKPVVGRMDEALQHKLEGR